MYWVHRDLGLIVLVAEMVLALMPPIKRSKLKNLVGSSPDFGPLGKGGRVDGVGYDTHAMVIQRIER